MGSCTCRTVSASHRVLVLGMVRVAATEDQTSMHVDSGTQTEKKRTLVVQLTADGLGEARLELRFMSYDFSFCQMGGRTWDYRG